jgi:uncharacterized membrane protein YciS (DUF1049 family)
MADQSFEKHAMYVPAFHFILLPAMALNVGLAIYWCFHTEFKMAAVLGILVALGLLVGVVGLRIMALKVQDRVIRLEERLRFERVLPADLQARIGEFTIEQLVGLRFASNSELPELARKVLEENVKTRKEIKRMIKVWRPDFARA